VQWVLLAFGIIGHADYGRGREGRLVLCIMAALVVIT